MLYKENLIYIYMIVDTSNLVFLTLFNQVTYRVSIMKWINNHTGVNDFLNIYVLSPDFY